MLKRIYFFSIGLTIALLLSACTANQTPLAIDRESAVPGTQVSRQGKTFALTGTGIASRTEIAGHQPC